jgi:dTMP kinase
MKKDNSNQGFFITIEGIEGVGKSTALQFLEKHFREQKFDYLVTREPGGTPLAETIRNIILGNQQETMCPETELMLFFAGRAQHLQHAIIPALQLGKVVLCDRFTDATYAYQGGGRGISREAIVMLEDWVQRGLQPDLTLLLDAPVELGISRILARSPKDRIEQEEIDFFERVRQVYLERAHAFPDRFRIIDASQSLQQVQKNIQEIIQNFSGSR